MTEGQENRSRNAWSSLEGLSVGDAFGEQFFASPRTVGYLIDRRALPKEPWRYTDDTVMALAIVEVLDRCDRIDPDLLARAFAAKYAADPARGYGGMAHTILQKIAIGEPWAEVSAAAFDGMGSMGNGGAMRAAPIGAYFADDFGRAATEARLSASVTHAHAEGQAGAAAVAVAAAAVGAGGSADDLFAAAVEHTPEGKTRAGILCARELPASCGVRQAVAALGNGSRVIAQDTVPFCLWCAARHLGNFEEAMWATVSGLGDRDTTCAIVGGILAAGAETTRAIPPAWVAARESLDTLRGVGVADVKPGTRE